MLRLEHPGLFLRQVDNLPRSAAKPLKHSGRHPSPACLRHEKTESRYIAFA
jgi:hypothetical protein